MIVSFSGIDSAGKSTQIELLHQYLTDNGIKVKKVWSKARGTPGVIFLKELVRRDKKMDSNEKNEYRKAVYQNPKKKKLLFVASMLDLCWYWGIYYRILGATNKVLICDRYLWDTYVEINSDFKGIEIDRSFWWKAVKFLAPKPKISFVFVIPAEVSLSRDRQKNAAGIEDIETKQFKIDKYMECVSANRWTDVMNGMESIEELQCKVQEKVNSELKRK